MEYLQKVLSGLGNNIFVQVAGLIAIIIGPIADAVADSSLFYGVAAVFFFLFVWGFIDELKKAKRYKSEIINFPVVIKVDDGPNEIYAMNNLIQNIEKEYGFNNYAEEISQHFKINIESFVFRYHGDIYDFEKLLTFARIIKYKLNEVEKRLDGRVKFHVVYYRRPSVGFLLGTLFRTEGIVVYQNNDFKNRFEKVSDISTREYKERAEKFEHYNVTESFLDEQSSEVLVVINSASHSVNTNAAGLTKYHNSVALNFKKDKSIPYDANWSLYAAEMYSILNSLQTKFSKIVIAHSMPESLSIILGMAMENYWNCEITQYDSQDYKYVFNMKDICYYNF